MNEITTTTANELAEWQTSSDFTSEDLTIPKILLTQKMSKVLDKIEGARAGEFRDSLEWKLLGGKKGVDVVLFDYFKMWNVHEENGGRFLRAEPVTATDAKREFIANGTKNYYVHNYYALLANEDPAEAMPYLVSFKSTSAKTAKKLNSVFLKMRAKGLPISNFIVTLTSECLEGEKGTYYVINAEVTNRVTPDAMKFKALEWLKIVRSSQVKVAEDDGDIPF